MNVDATTLNGIDLTDASVWERATPHDWLDRLRSEDPVHWHPETDGPGFWALTRHDDVHRVSTSPSGIPAMRADRYGSIPPARAGSTTCG